MVYILDAQPKEKAMRSNTKSYRVTDVAGPRPDIAGKRRKVDEVLELNEMEAEFELSRGTIVLIPAKEAKEAKEKSGAGGNKA